MEIMTGNNIINKLCFRDLHIDFQGNNTRF